MKINTKVLCLIILICATSLTGICQNHGHNLAKKLNQAQTEHDFKRHMINFYTGFTHIPSKHYSHVHAEGLSNTGNWVPTVGLDYFYKLTHRFSVGIMADMEIDQYEIVTKGQEEIIRENVMIIALVAKFEIVKGLNILAGPGYERMFSTEGEDFCVLKAGVEYEIEFGDNFQFAPSLVFDYKDVYQTVSYGFSIGKKF
ncbi:hypothetical protein [Persicobacter diffluens]|uniref:Outer membrane protein beta-barrel domain-containing protein n=1 Tax=Persicobacter diffluens TaxID=981 RepID=A0AAN4W4E9_9BACT|nr:hypothetical protein PEDI_44120 [Persicobacter diffluens]